MLLNVNEKISEFLYFNSTKLCKNYCINFKYASNVNEKIPVDSFK